MTASGSRYNARRCSSRAWWGRSTTASASARFGGEPISEAAFTVPAHWSYAYLELEDAQGRRAWSNPLFVTNKTPRTGMIRLESVWLTELARELSLMGQRSLAQLRMRWPG